MGPVKAGFTGNVELKDLKPPHSYRIEGTGEGGIAGFATGGANVNLEAVPEGTRLSYDLDAQMGGKLAMLGSRLIDFTARSIAGQFFEKFAKVAAAMKPETNVVKAKKSPVKKTPAKKKASKKVARIVTVKKPTVKKKARKKARKQF